MQRGPGPGLPSLHSLAPSLSGLAAKLPLLALAKSGLRAGSVLQGFPCLSHNPLARGKGEAPRPCPGFREWKKQSQHEAQAAFTGALLGAQTPPSSALSRHEPSLLV